MQETKEGLVELKQISEGSKFKTIGFNVNTLQSGEVEFITKPIKGFIECLIIQTESETTTGSTHIKVYMKNEEICILDMAEFKGTEYIAPRVSAMYNDYSVSEYQAERWSIDGPLHFKINGPKDVKVKFIVRYY